MLDTRLTSRLADPESRRFGHGWISGVIAVSLAATGLGAVLCLHFPELLTSPRLRAYYPLPLVRAALQAVLVLAFIGGALSVVLRRRKTLGLVALALASSAVVLGGSGVPVPDAVDQSPVYLGLDWFLLNVLITALVFVPLEQAWPQRPGQSLFRPAWTLDLTWFLVSHVAVQLLSWLIVTPAAGVAAALAIVGWRDWCAALPLWVQVPCAVLVADLTQYWVHRAFHRMPWLWRFHRVHHSTTSMDWLAGSRIHFVDVVATRAAVLAALLACGFATPALAAYLVVVATQAVFVHANFAPRARWLERVLVMPRFHHWHHAAESAALDKNFAVHFPWLDALFGTAHLPRDAWPARYGLIDAAVPASWFGQLLWPFASGVKPAARCRGSRCETFGARVRADAPPGRHDHHR